jgi:hypothetical protein
MSKLKAIAVAGMVASFAAGAADIQKCADVSGGVVYQDAPCPPGRTLGSLPRESAHGDPAALAQLERERARLARAADAHIAAQMQQEGTAPQVQQQPAMDDTLAQQPGVSAYAPPLVGVDPNTGEVFLPATTALPQGVTPSTTQPPAPTQPNATQPQPTTGITQPPTAAPLPITQVPAAVTRSQSGTASPSSVSPPST